LRRIVQIDRNPVNCRVARQPLADQLRAKMEMTEDLLNELVEHDRWFLPKPVYQRANWELPHDAASLTACGIGPSSAAIRAIG
jgi:hypothetical protein